MGPQSTTTVPQSASVSPAMTSLAPPSATLGPIMAAIVGALLMLYATLIPPNRPGLILSLTSGLGMLLGAVGSAAQVKGKGWVISGSGAIGLILGGCYIAWDNKPVFGDISGQFTQETQIVLVDKYHLLGALQETVPGSFQYEFALENSRLQDGEIKVYIKEAPDTPKKSGVVAQASIATDLAKGEDLHWSYDGTTLKDHGGTVLTRLTSTPTFGYGETSRFEWPSLVPSAFAKFENCEPSTIKAAVDGLSSQSIDVQVRVEEGIADCGMASVPVLLAALSHQSGVGRYDLMYSLLDIARQSPDRPKAIAELAGTDGLAPVVQALGKPKPETAALAGALLIELRDPAIAGPVIAFAEQSTDPTTRRLAINVLEGLLGRMDAAQQQSVREAVAAMKLPDDTGTPEVTKLTEAVDAFGTPRFFVVTASFVKEKDAVAKATELTGKVQPARTAAVRQLKRAAGAGYYVVCVGPLTLTSAVDARAELIATGAAPRDAWLTASSGFIPQPA